MISIFSFCFVTKFLYFHPILRNIFPQNILQAGFQHTKTVYVQEKPEKFVLANKSDSGSSTTPKSLISTAATTAASILNASDVDPVKWVRTYPMADGVNVLGGFLHFVSLFIGNALNVFLSFKVVWKSG